MRDPLSRIACTVADRLDDVVERARSAGCRIVELRLDKTGLDGAREAVEALAGDGVRVIVTLREAREGGSYTGGWESKLGVYRSLLEAGAWLVDVEYSHPEFTRFTSELGDRVLASAHYYRFTPASDILYSTVGDMLRSGAGIAKIAAAVEAPEDNWRLITLNSWRPGRIVSIGMGRRGLVSRLLAPLAGAPFTYAHLGEAAAPGQPSVQEVLEYWRMLGVIG